MGNKFGSATQAALDALGGAGTKTKKTAGTTAGSRYGSATAAALDALNPTAPAEQPQATNRYQNYLDMGSVVRDISGADKGAAISPQKIMEEFLRRQQNGTEPMAQLTNPENTGARIRRYEENRQQLAALEEQVQPLYNQYRQENPTHVAGQRTALQQTAEGRALLQRMDALAQEQQQYERLYKSSDYGADARKQADFPERAAVAPHEEDAEYIAVNFDRYTPSAEKVARIKADPTYADMTEPGTGIWSEKDALYQLDDTLRSAWTLHNKSGYKNMTDEERDTYNYLYETRGKEAAHQYLQDQIIDVDKRESQKRVENFATAYDNVGGVGKAALNLATVPASVYGGMVSAAGDTLSALGGKYNPYSGSHAMTEFAQAIRGKTAEEIAAGINNETVGAFASNTYQAILSAADSVLGAATMGHGYTVAMGAGAASSRAKELYEQGAGNIQVLQGSIASGVAETLFEYVSLDKLIKTGASRTVKEWVTNILKQSFTEASEEVSTEIANKVTDALIRGGQSDHSRAEQAYIEAGETPENARRLAWRDDVLDVLWAGYGGAVSGGLSAAAYGGVGTMQNIQEVKQIGQAYLTEGSDGTTRLGDAMEIGLSNATGTEALETAQRIQSKLQQGKQPTAYQIGKMLLESSTPRAMRARVIEADILDSARENGVDDKTARSVAALMVRADRAARFVSPETLQTTGENGTVNQAAGSYRADGVVELASNITTDEAMDFVIKHELTHAIEGSTAYEKIKALVQQSLGEAEYAAAVERERQSRSAKGDARGAAGAEAEVIADWVGENLYNGDIHTGFARMIQNMDGGAAVKFQAVLDSFQRTLGFTGNMRQAAALRSAERAFAEVLHSDYSSANENTAAETGDGRQYDINPDFEKEYEAWDKKSTGGYFVLGTTSDALQSVGINPTKIYWDKSKIKKILDNPTHHMENAIPKVPELLEHPILIMQSQTVLNRVVLLGEINDDLGYPVLCALELRPNGEINDFVKVASAYGKDSRGGVQSLIDTSDILYVDPNKNRTDSWLEARRLQLPVGLTNYGSIGRVTYFKKDVKGNFTISGATSQKTAMQTAFEKAMQPSTQSQYMQNGENNSSDGQKSYLPADLQERENAAYGTAQAHSQAAEGLQTGEVKFQKRSAEGIEPQDVEQLRSIGRKSVNEFTSEEIQKAEKWARKFYRELGTKSPFFRAWFGDWRAQDTTPIIVADTIGQERGIVRNKDTQWDIQVSGQVFSETNHNSNAVSTARAYLPYINSIVQNAVLLDTVAIPSGKEKSANSAWMHSLYAVADIGNGKELLKLYVEELNDVGSDGTIRRAYQLQNIENQRLSAKGSGASPLASSQATADIRTISDLFSVVNSKDKNFHPKPVSKALLNADGTPKVMYHQTDADFTVFNTSNQRAGKLDTDTPTGMFFKPTDQDIGISGEKQMAVYLNARNMLELKNREEAHRYWMKNVPQYAELQELYDAVDKEYNARYENAEAEGDTWYEQHYDELVSGQISDAEAMQIMDAPLDEILAEWKSKTEPIAVKQKELITAYMQQSQYDGLHLLYDGSRNGVDVETYIVFSPTQIKSATDNIGTFDGSNPDIRYSYLPAELMERENAAAAEKAENARRLAEEQSEKQRQQETQTRRQREETAGELRRQNAELRKRLERAQRETRVTTEKTVREEDVAKLTRRILREYSSTLKSDSILDAMQTLGDTIVQGEQLNYDTLHGQALDIARQIVDHSEALIDDGEGATYDGIRQYLRENKIAVREAEKADIPDYEAWRRRNQRRLNLSREGTPVDVIYGEMQELFGKGLLPDILNPSEQLQYLAELRDNMEPEYGNPYDSDLEQAAEACAGDILDGMLSAQVRQTSPTYADKAQAQLERQKNLAHAALEREVQRRHRALETQRNRYRDLLTRERVRTAEARVQGENAVRETKAENRQRNREAAERRKRTAEKQRVGRMLDSLEAMLAHPDKNHHIPVAATEAVRDLLATVREDPGDIQAQINELQLRLQDTSDGRQIARIRRRIAERQARLDKTTSLYEAVSKVQDRYGDIAGKTLDDKPGNPGFQHYLQEVKEMVNGRTVSDLSAAEMHELVEVMKAVHGQLKQMNTLHGKGFREGAQETGLHMAEEMTAAKGYTNTAMRNLMLWQLTPDRFFETLCGWKQDSVGAKLAAEMNEAQRTQLEILRAYGMLFDGVTNGSNAKNYERLSSTKDADMVDVGLVDSQGKPMKMTRGLMLSLYESLCCKGNRDAIVHGGMILPQLKLYYGGQTADAYVQGQALTPTALSGEIHGVLEEMNKFNKGSQEYANLQKQYMELVGRANQDLDRLKARIEGEMTDYERQLHRTVRQWFDKDSKRYINDVTSRIWNYEAARVKDYYPIYRSKDFVSTALESLVVDRTLASNGNLKARQKSKAPVLIADITQVLHRSADQTARFCGWTAFQEDFTRIYNTKSDQTSFKRALGLKWGAGKAKLGVTGDQYIQNLMADISGGRESGSSFLRFFRQNAVRATLSVNMRVAVSQAASLPTAAAEIGWKYTARAMKHLTEVNRQTMDRIADYSAYFYERRRGAGGMEEFALAKDGSNVLDKAYQSLDKATKGRLLNWCQEVDIRTVALCWFGCEEAVQDTRPELKAGSDAYYKAVGEMLDRVIIKTQPNFTVAQRSDLLRTKNEAVKFLTMYKTQANQNMNILYEVTGRLRAALQSGDKKQIQAAKKAMVNGYTAVIAGGTIAFVLLRTLVNLLQHRVKGYRDKDGEITAASMTGAIGQEVLSSMAGMFAFGDAVYDVVSARVFGERYYGVSDVALGNVSSLLEDFATGNFTSETAWSHLWRDTMNALGIPWKNLEDIAGGIIGHITDIAHGEFLSFNANSGVETTAYYRQLLHAQQNGKTEKAAKVQQFLLDSGKTPAQIQAGLRKVMQEDGDFQKREKRLLREAMESVMYRSMTEQEQKKVKSGLDGYLADTMLADSIGSRMTTAHQKAQNAIDRGVSPAAYYVGEAAKNGITADKNGDGTVTRQEYRAMLSQSDYDQITQAVLLAQKSNTKKKKEE